MSARACILTHWYDILALPPAGRRESAGRPRQDRWAGVTRIFAHLSREGRSKHLSHVNLRQCAVAVMLESHQSSWADLAGAVAALAGQVLAVGQEARGPSALERQPGVDERGGSTVMVHKERLQARNRHVFSVRWTWYSTLKLGLTYKKKYIKI